MANQAITFYWRPGCGFCAMLDRKLSRLEIPMEKRNIWDDPEAADFVRSVADGSETVPTVTVGTVSMVNPSADQVLRAMSEHTPDLLPEGVEPGEPGRIGKAIGRILGN